MKLKLNKTQLGDYSSEEFLLRNGFARIFDSRAQKESFVRRLGSYFYPRFHVYIKEQGNDVVFDLHIDQKQTSYSGSHMHNAEYDGQIVENEVKRLKNIIESLAISTNTDSITKEDEGTKKSDKSWLKSIFS